MGIERITRLINWRILCAAIFLSVNLLTADDYSDWLYSQAFILNTKDSCADVAGNVRNFPVLVRLNPALFSSFSQTLPDGADIRFAKSNGTHLSYHIERWIDNADDNDTAEIWVRLDTVYGNSAQQYFIMYWGNEDAVDSSASSMVFRANNGFMAAYHLAGNIEDATSNLNNGIEVGNGNNDPKNGIIGYARFFGGGACFQAIGLPERPRGTLSFWFRTETTFNAQSSTTQGIWGKTESDEYNANISLRGADFLAGGSGTTGQIQAKIENDNGGYYNNSTTSVFTAGSWYYVAWVWGDGRDSIYINGTLESAAANSKTVTGASSDEIGRAYYDVQNIDAGGPRYFIGTLDEFRIDNIVRSAHWIKLCYENQKSDQKFIQLVSTDQDLISREPHDTIVPVGTRASFSVVASGQGTLRYTWHRFPSDSVGSASVYSIASVSSDDAGAQFRCIVRDDFGTDTSEWAVLTVIDTPRIAIQPENVTVTIGETATMNLSVLDSRQLTFSWYKVGSDSVLGAVGSFTITTVSFSDSGDYYCIISNPVGTLHSDTVRLTVLHIPPTISIQPVDVSVIEGDAAGFSVTASGNAPPSYAWKKVGSDSLFGTAASLRFATTTYSDSGDYFCIVSNPAGTLHTDTVRLSITKYLIPPSITAQPVDVSVSEGDSAEFSVTASGSAPLQYAWKKVGSDSLFGTTASLRFSVVTFSDSGTYYCIVGNAAATLNSNMAHLSIVRYEAVTIFDAGSPNDTISVFNGRIHIWKDASYTATEVLTDTIEIKLFDSFPEGLERVGVPFVFKQGNIVDSIFIGIRIDSLPVGKTIDAVRIYRESAGGFFVDRQTVIDSVRKIAYVKTSDINQTFVAMLDTIAPVMTVLSDTGTPIFSGNPLKDSIHIVDNIHNVRWRYFYGSGDEVPALREMGILFSESQAIAVTISDTSQAISSASGLRALLVVDDGCNVDTINVSRRVYRDESDKLSTGDSMWNPICPSAHLFRTSPDFLIGQLIKGSEVETYDQRYMRLYRWFGCKENDGITDKWIEYDKNRADICSLFTFEPGRLFWLKTREDLSVHLDTAYTLSLKEPFSIALPPEQWTDFGMPYQFSVRMEEILTATGKAADSLLFYRWKRDSSASIYTLDPHYVQGIPNKTDKMTTIDYLPRGGYSVYNNNNDTVTLRIPPVPVSMTNILTKRAHSNQQPWSTKFLAQADNRTSIPAVYFGYAPGTDDKMYPLTPSFADVRLSVFNRETSKRYGHAISESAKEGLVKELLISSNSDSAHTIQYRLEHAGAFPDSYTAYCYDETGKHPATSGTIAVFAHSSVSRWIVIGDAAFQNGFTLKRLESRFALHSIYPNPSRSAVTIRYSIPFGTNEYVRVGIYSMLGKKVWEKKIDRLLSEGDHELFWNGRNSNNKVVVAGIYVVRLTMENKRGKIIRQFEKCMTILK